MTTSNRTAFKKLTKQNGLTILELLAVTAIVSAIIMISLPMYQNYRVRSQVGGDLPMMRPLMLLMNEEYALNGQWPASNEEANAHAPTSYRGNYLLSATITDEPQAGTMTLKYDSDKLPVLRGTDTIVFYPKESSNRSEWLCDQGSIPSKYRPTQCRE